MDIARKFIKKNILITGANSRFAIELKKKFYGPNIFYKTKKELNILNINSIKKNLLKHKIKILIHLAALSRPMAIHETDIISSIDINIIGTANIVKACAEKNIKLIYFSTSYVYEGKNGNYKETDPVLPVNNYAWSKLGGEASVHLYENSLILRLAMTEYPFIHPVAFTNAKNNFIYRNEVIKILPKLLNEKGVVNIGGQHSSSIYNFAKKNNPLVMPRKLKKLDNFPRNTSVNINKLKKILKKIK
jgi:dTDP-4-dehydrorhamnose reductase